MCPKTLVTTAILFASASLNAQQGNIWYFGRNAGIDFNTTPPSYLLNGAVYTREGCACISDNNGSILFYTEGRTVYNRNHQAMPNGTGLFGDISTTQSAIIVPKPGSTNLYFIFTADSRENAFVRGYNYSIVDINLDGGLGDVLQENTPLFAPGTERLTAVRAANGVDVWVCTNVPYTNQFKSFKVSCDGVDPNPVVSNVGEVLNLNDFVNVGFLKISPDGKKAFQTISEYVKMGQLFDFDNTTGKFSNPIKLAARGSFFGAEFSPNSKILYAGEPAEGRIYQYDITGSDSITINSSLYKIDPPIENGALQLGPNGKIYCAEADVPYLHVINNPDILGAGCNLQKNAQYMGGRDTYTGLPTFMPNFFAGFSVNFSFSIQSDCNTVSFNGSTTLPGNITWEWDFGDGTFSNQQNPVHVFPPGGNVYNVKLKSVSDQLCGDASIGKQVNLNRIIPGARFRFDAQCGNNTVNFFDTSLNSGVINFREWDFGDGITSTAQNPLHTYAGVGNYTVRLVVGNMNACGGTDTIWKSVPIESKPVAAFANSKTCVNQLVSFANQSSIASGSITQCYWNFGDGTTSTQQNPQKIYSSTGQFEIKMVAKSSTGCISDTARKFINVTSIPIAAFTAANGCFNQVQNFQDNSTITSGAVNRWHWDFGDGNISSLQNGQHIYTTYGSYLIKHVVESNGGCVSDTVYHTIQLDSKPVADFSAIITCGNKQVKFNDATTNTLGNITQWNWQFGDGNVSSNQNASNTYGGYTTYYAKLMTTSQNGCVADTTKIIETIAKPMASFDFQKACVNQLIQFTDRSSVEANSINQWQWNLANGNSNSQNPQSTYVVAGDYQIRLIVFSDKGCADTVSKPFKVEAIPIANMSFTSGCEGQIISFVDQSSISFGNIDKWNWSLGNGDTSAQRNFNYPYPTGNNYTVSLFVESVNGCKSSIVTKPITIESIPKVLFDNSSACIGKEIQFQNLSMIDFGIINSYSWQFGNGSTSNDLNPVQIFNNSGKYTVKLTAISLDGCIASYSKQFDIAPMKVFAGNDTIAARGMPIQLHATGGKYYEWQPPEFLNNPSSDHPIATLDHDQDYRVKVTTAEGCVAYDDVKIRIIKGPDIYVPNAFTPNGSRNRIFRPILVGISELYYFSVYNRWGQLVFQTKEISKGWDGTFGGKQQPEGSYVWMLRVRDVQGNISERKGTVLLVR